MKMLKAIIRPEKEKDVLDSLEGIGLFGVTKFDVLGRGKQKGIKLGERSYDELPKLMLLLAVEDKDAKAAIEAITTASQTGNYGDGKIFITELEEVYTIRTGKKGL